MFDFIRRHSRLLTFLKPSAIKFHTPRKTKWTERRGIQLAPDASPLDIDLKNGHQSAPRHPIICAPRPRKD